MGALRPALLMALWGLSLGLLALLSPLAPGGSQNVYQGLLALILVLISPVIVVSATAYCRVYFGSGELDGIVRHGPICPVAALTFDDGPSPVYTPQVLDILKEKGVKATFFLVGSHAERYPDIVRRIAAEGHDIGIHTYSHRELMPASRRVVLEEVRKTERAICAASGRVCQLVRPPRGLYTAAVRRLLQNEGYTLALWSVSSGDWLGISAKAILRRIRASMRPGGIILFHDSGALLRTEGAARANTISALAPVIDYLSEHRGFEIMSISEMLLLPFGEAESALDSV